MTRPCASEESKLHELDQNYTVTASLSELLFTRNHVIMCQDASLFLLSSMFGTSTMVGVAQCNCEREGLLSHLFLLWFLSIPFKAFPPSCASISLALFWFIKSNLLSVLRQVVCRLCRVAFNILFITTPSCQYIGCGHRSTICRMAMQAIGQHG